MKTIHIHICLKKKKKEPFSSIIYWILKFGFQNEKNKSDFENREKKKEKKIVCLDSEWR